MKAMHIVLVAVAALALGACGSTGKKDTPGAQPVSTGDRDSTSGIGSRDSSEPVALTEAQRQQREREALARDNVVYFDFDRAELRPDALETIRRHGAFLARNSSTRVQLEGHTDERGTREYNIGLGERRARSVADALRSMGVSASQINLISYGEERPAQLGSNEAAWAKNRRVEIVYR